MSTKAFEFRAKVFTEDIPSGVAPHKKAGKSRQLQDDPVFVSHTRLSPDARSTLVADTHGQLCVVDTATLQLKTSLTYHVTPEHRCVTGAAVPLQVRKGQRPVNTFVDVAFLSDYTGNQADSNIVLAAKSGRKSVLMIDTRANKVVHEFSTGQFKKAEEIESDDSDEDDSSMAAMKKKKSKKRKSRTMDADGFMVANVASFAVNCNGNLFALGTEVVEDEAAICFWDVRAATANAGEKSRSNGVVNVFTDCHSEDVTQIAFHPSVPNALASGSTDSLVNLYNLSTIQDEYSCLHQTLNGESVAQLGFFGPEESFVYSISHMESLLMWRFIDGEEIATFRDIRRTYNKGVMQTVKKSKAAVPVMVNDLIPSEEDEQDNQERKTSTNDGRVKVDYIIDTKYDRDSGRLFLIGGNTKGDVSILNVGLEGFELTHYISAGVHSDIVRSVSWDPKARVMVTGGEDGYLGSWAN